MSGQVRTESRGDIAIVWVDHPPVNALSQAVRQGLVDAVAELAVTDHKAIVLAGVNDTFIAGADIREFGKPPMAPGLFEVCDAIEASPLPVVALVQGNTLGGGLEVALGAHYRVATANTRLGFPEVNLGLVPGAGGTQRTPRLIALTDAIDMVTSGKPVSGKRAAEMGLVDAVVDGDLLEAAIGFAAKIVDDPFEERRLSRRSIEMTDEVAEQFAAAMRAVEKRAKGAVAPIRAGECVRNAYTMPFADGLKAERDTFMELVVGDQSKAMRHMFFSERLASKPPKDISGEARPIRTVGVLGAGTMGGGIAMTYAEAGLPVTLLDMSQEALDRGLSVIEKNWRRGIRSGRVTEAGVSERMARLHPTTSFDDLADCDLIIEAVFETMDVKRDVFRKIDAVAKPGAVLATNTSYLDVDAIAAETDRPQDVLGMHYFSPANIMKLLEIVRAEKTADDVLLTALKAAKLTGKTAVIAGVGHGFIGNRLLTPYQRQAHLMLLEGASPQQIDQALTRFGMAMGPFAMGDLAGLDIGYKSRQDQDLNEEERRVYRIADALVEAGHLGQKSGSGFYSYDPETRARSHNPAAEGIVNKVRTELGINQREISDEEIIERTQFALANEGAHVLSEGIAARSSDIDTVYVHGYGYPRWRGGPMHYAETVGLKTVAEKLREWSNGPNAVHWTPSDLLMERAEGDGGFDQ
ncbi:MAG: 3-hydroxyacyl-CoA dehydrogenase NAD-binding domain-containing protein [Ahrensia sp.]|nr:3-hydroxyacyl-CoA dehydrogenase NAD-binding domain-containing protein [Ahrensia sp.]